MPSGFLQRFLAIPATGEPRAFQLLYAEPPRRTVADMLEVLRGYHPEMASATVEWHDVTDPAEGYAAVSGEGPPACAYGLIGWGRHRFRVYEFAAAMPYGPVETCVVPAMMPPEVKAAARQHQAHSLLEYVGDHPEPLEHYVALAATAGALCRFGGITVLHEEARAAVPWYDLLPDDEEDGLETLRALPIPYLWGGFVKLDVGESMRPWVRTFACHRLRLPNLAYHLSSHAETSRIFQVFSALLGYLRETGSELHAGDELDFGEFRGYVRTPHDAEWYLDKAMFVLEAVEHDGAFPAEYGGDPS